MSDPTQPPNQQSLYLIAEAAIETLQRDLLEAWASHAKTVMYFATRNDETEEAEVTILLARNRATSIRDAIKLARTFMGEVPKGDRWP